MVYRILLLWLLMLVPEVAKCACLISSGCVYPVGNQNVAPTAALPNLNGYAISQGFFTSLSPTHAGVDLANGLAGGAVRTMADGRVVELRASNTGFGWALRIEHTLVTGELVYSIYGHMVSGSLAVNVGDTVTKGQIIGQVDSTGLSTANHLHFAIRNVPDFGCGYVPSTLAQCANDVQSNYRDPLAFIVGPPQAVTFLSFTEGNPGLPGDGIFVNAGGPFNVTFDLATPFSLNGITNGITATAFLVPNQGLQSIQLNLQKLGTSCTAALSTGGVTTVSFNGVTGFSNSISQSALDFAVSGINRFEPGCSTVTLSDLSVVQVLINLANGQIGTTLDAAAITLGQNTFPSQ